MDKDLGFASDAGAVDVAYDTGLFGSDLSGATESERQVGSEPIPRCEGYFLKVVGGQPYSTEVAYPDGSEVTTYYARLNLEVQKGPKGTEKRQFSSGVFFHINPFKKNKDGSKGAPRTKKEYDEAKSTLSDDLMKIVRVLNLSRKTPSDNTEEAVTAWISQAVEAGKTFIGEVRVRKANEEKGYSASNELSWRSIAALDDPVFVNKKQVPGATAASVALKEIEKVDKRAEKKAGTTAQSHGPAAPTSF